MKALRVTVVTERPPWVRERPLGGRTKKTSIEIITFSVLAPLVQVIVYSPILISVVGVPVIIPVEGLITKPVGRAGETWKLEKVLVPKKIGRFSSIGTLTK